jgi:Siphovirus Gp157
VSDLTLFDIERGLHDLMDRWQEAETPEEMQQAELAIRAVAELEVRKVDNVRKYLRFCAQMAAAAKQEAQQQKNRQGAWEARRDRLKAFCYEVMMSFGLRKLEGQTGTLSIRGNGGLQPLTITDPALVPDDLADITVTMSTQLWPVLLDLAHDVAAMHHDRSLKADLEAIKIGPRTPSNERIREALAKPCPACKGAGGVDLTAYGGGKDEPCPDCNGSKTASVPGCRLEPRAESLIVK